MQARNRARATPAFKKSRLEICGMVDLFLLAKGLADCPNVSTTLRILA